MTLPRLTYLDYVRAAFWRRLPVAGLGRMPVNQMAIGAFAVLGVANPGFWLLGAALEVAYLATLSGSGRFQTLVNGERLMAAHEGWETQVHGAVERLNEDRQARYRKLLGQCRAILGLSDALEADTLGSLRDLKTRNLNQLLTIFLRLLTSQELIRANLASVDGPALEQEVARLGERVAGLGQQADSALARSLHGTLDIQRKRLENLARADTSLAVIDAELLRIEQQVELLREEAAVAGDAQVLSQRLDAVTTQMTETSRWMDENSQLLGSLGGEELGTELAALPRLPETE